MVDTHDLLVADLKRHEGFRGFAYKDTVGKLTIGYGRNIDLGGRGISKTEGEYLLGNDAIQDIREASELVPLWVTLDSTRQAVIANLAHNLGKSRLSGFVKFLAAVETKDWETAAKELVNSSWYKQVGHRGPELVERLLTGIVI